MIEEVIHMAEEITTEQPLQPEGTDQSQQQTNNENNGDTQTATLPVKEDGLPEDSKERTKQRFDELTKQLTEERQSKKALEDAFKVLKTQAKVQGKPEEEAPESVLDENGYLNEAALTNYQRRAIEAEKRATEAKEQVERFTQEQKQKEATRQEEVEAKEAYTAHPDLNPGDKAFNKELHDFTTAIILQERYMNGKNLTFKEAGDRAKASIAKIVGEAKAEGAQEAMGQLDAKETAALETTGSPNRRQLTQQSLEELQQRSRAGDKDAMVERMRRLQGK